MNSHRRDKDGDHNNDDDDMSLEDWMMDDEFSQEQRQQQESFLALPHPSSESMQERVDFRQAIATKTLEHRRTKPHDSSSGRNIALILRDRELNGSSSASSSPQRSSAPTPTILPLHNKRNSSGRSMPFSPMSISREIQIFMEYSSVVRYHSSYLQHLGQDEEDSSNAVSTISVAFSPDGQSMASTHGDHTVKITSCATGGLLKTLEGHPRTPWTVKYHPSNSNIVASGCLGCQVRVWNWKDSVCLKMIRLDHAIISLSFHPSGHVLGIASGTRLHFWNYNNYGNDSSRDNNNDGNRGALTEVEQRHMLRCVHFPPCGSKLIVGGTNPPTEEQRRRAATRGAGMSGGGMTFYLRLWDFDLNAALHPQAAADSRDVLTQNLRLPRKPLSTPRNIIPRALLYNDGGFDVSPDGKTLCACAEFWLPEGINSAIELLHREELVDDDDDDENNESTEVLCEKQQQQQHDSSDPPGRSPEPDVSIDMTATMSTPQNSPPRHSMMTRSGSQQLPRVDSVPTTPPNPSGGRLHPQLSPPPPPGSLRFTSSLRQFPRLGSNSAVTGEDGAAATNGDDSLMFHTTRRPPTGMGPNPLETLSIVSGSLEFRDVAREPGRYVPHVVTVSLDDTPIIGNATSSTGVAAAITAASVAPRGYCPRLGQLLEAAPLDGSKATAVTCVKFSPSAEFLLLGYGVREPAEGGQHHPVTALYRIRGGMTHVSTMLSGDDDVNIARFHPDSGYGFVYGTKQGRVRILGPRPWNYYNC